MPHFLSRTLAAISIAAISSTTFAAGECFQIPTHYSKSLDAAVEGATDTIFFPSDEAGPYYTAGGFKLLYPPNRLPFYQSYLGTDFTTTTFVTPPPQQPLQDCIDWRAKIINKIGVNVDFRIPSLYTITPTNPQSTAQVKAALVDNGTSFQIIPNLRIGSSLITIIVPPGWRASAGAGTYPIIANGMYDIKGALTGESPIILGAIADAQRVNPNYRAITILWNGRGEIGSRTADSSAITEFTGSILSTAEAFGGDRNRLFVEGVSRGAITALRIAATAPTKAVFASVPAGAMGDIADMTDTTTPELIAAAEWSIGIRAPWKANWTYPSSVGNSSLYGLTQNQAHLKILTGVSGSATANNSSASPRSSIAALASSGANLYLELGSHDFIIPWIDHFRYLNAVKASGVKYEAVINYLGGHYRDEDLMRTKIATALTRLYQNNPNLLVSPGSVQRRILSASGSGVFESVSRDLFTLELPAYVSPSAVGAINATGQPGTVFRIGYNPSGSSYNCFVPPEYSATIGADGTFSTPLGLGSLQPGITEVCYVLITLPNGTQKGASRWTSTYTPRNIYADAVDPDKSGRRLASDIEALYRGNASQLPYANPGCKANFSGNTKCAAVTWGVTENP